MVGPEAKANLALESEAQEVLFEHSEGPPHATLAVAQSQVSIPTQTMVACPPPSSYHDALHVPASPDFGLVLGLVGVRLLDMASGECSDRNSPAPPDGAAPRESKEAIGAPADPTHDQLNASRDKLTVHVEGPTRDISFDR